MSGQPAVLVVTGASGAGKSTLVRGLSALELPGVGCYEFDSVGVPSPEESRGQKLQTLRDIVQQEAVQQSNRTVPMPNRPTRA